MNQNEDENIFDSPYLYIGLQGEGLGSYDTREYTIHLYAKNDGSDTVDVTNEILPLDINMLNILLGNWGSQTFTHLDIANLLQ
mgnify:CR=1 FL=1